MSDFKCVDLLCECSWQCVMTILSCVCVCNSRIPFVSIPIWSDLFDYKHTRWLHILSDDQTEGLKCTHCGRILHTICNTVRYITVVSIKFERTSPLLSLYNVFDPDDGFTGISIDDGRLLYFRKQSVHHNDYYELVYIAIQEARLGLPFRLPSSLHTWWLDHKICEEQRSNNTIYVELTGKFWSWRPAATFHRS